MSVYPQAHHIIPKSLFKQYGGSANETSIFSVCCLSVFWLFESYPNQYCVNPLPAH